MANLIIPTGGTGTQADRVANPLVVPKTVWEANNPSDFMGSNGGYLVSGTYTLDYDGGSGPEESRITGDFSSCIVGMYIFVNPGSTTPGYHEIMAINGTTSVDIDAYDLDGNVLTVSDDGPADVNAGGACGAGSAYTAIENANDTIINYIDVDSHSIDVLYNLDETTDSGGFSEIDVSPGLLQHIRFIGTVYDASVADNNFAAFTSIVDKADFPTITVNTTSTSSYYFYVSGDHLDLRHIHITGACSTFVLRAYRGYGCHYEQCWVEQTNTGATYGQAIAVDSSSFTGCYISTVGTQDEPLINDYRGSYKNCIFKAERSGIYTHGNYGFSIMGCIFICTGTSPGYGIYNETGLAAGGADVHGNIFYGFKTSVYLYTLDTGTTDMRIRLINNVIWGTNESGGYGIYNNESATKERKLYCLNNFIGNVENEDNYNNIDLEHISLTTNPFSDSTPSDPEDFYFNNTAGGGALIKEKAFPLDFDMDGTQDNFATPCITEEPATGGGSGSILIPRGNLIGAMES